MTCWQLMPREAGTGNGAGAPPQNAHEHTRTHSGRSRLDVHWSPKVAKGRAKSLAARSAASALNVAYRLPEPKEVSKPQIDLRGQFPGFPPPPPEGPSTLEEPEEPPQD